VPEETSVFTVKLPSTLAARGLRARARLPSRRWWPKHRPSTWPATSGSVRAGERSGVATEYVFDRRAVRICQ
jgi:hypothetical protein